MEVIIVLPRVFEQMKEKMEEDFDKSTIGGAKAKFIDKAKRASVKKHEAARQG